MEEQRIESEENQLRNELEKICLDYKELVKKSAEMAPKDANTKKTGPNGECEVNDDEFEGICFDLFQSFVVRTMEKEKNTHTKSNFNDFIVQR